MPLLFQEITNSYFPPTFSTMSFFDKGISYPHVSRLKLGEHTHISLKNL